MNFLSTACFGVLPPLVQVNVWLNNSKGLSSIIEGKCTKKFTLSHFYEKLENIAIQLFIKLMQTRPLADRFFYFYLAFTKCQLHSLEEEEYKLCFFGHITNADTHTWLDRVMNREWGSAAFDKSLVVLWILYQRSTVFITLPSYPRLLCYSCCTI